MSQRDSETFARFARRFSAINAEIGDPPLARWRAGGTPTRLRTRPVMTAIAVVAVVTALAVLSPWPTGRLGPTPTGSGPAVGGVASSPSPPPSSAPPTESEVPLDPRTPPEELAGPCLNHITVFDRMTTTVEQDAAISSSVVIGTITGIGKAQWNTTDGAPPSERHDIEPSRVMRLLRVKVETVVKGAAPAVATLSIPGGTIGCHRFDMGGFAEAQIGGRYVFFLNGATPRHAIEGAISAWQTWSIEGNRVATSFEGSLPIDMFIKRASGSG